MHTYSRSIASTHAALYSVSLLVLLICAPLEAQLLPASALNCSHNGLPGVPGEAGGFGSSASPNLFVPTAPAFPANVFCNDGTTPVYYVRRAQRAQDRNRWHIHLEGGGRCSDGKSCASRWCSVDTNFGADKMSSSRATTSPRAGGIFSTAPNNAFRGWNHVLISYCSSDSWSGRAQNVPLSFTTPTGVNISYDIHFQGADILDAVLETLRQVNGPVTYDDKTGDVQNLPDLDEATIVLLTGSSAGSGGVKYNADRVGDLLAANNVNAGPLDFRAVVDAGFGRKPRGMDWPRSAHCVVSGFCDYETYMQHQWFNVSQALYNADGDLSCLNYHATTGTGKEFLCVDSTYLIQHHITTPLFVRVDLQDELQVRNYVKYGFGSAGDWGQIVQHQLAALEDLDSTSLEGSVLSGGPPLTTPGVFGPQCTDHIALTNRPFSEVQLGQPTGSYSFHDVLQNWLTGGSPQQVIAPYSGPGRSSTCP